MSETPLALRLAAAAGHPLARSTALGADWVCSAGRRPGIDAAALADRIAAVSGVESATVDGGLVLVRVAEGALAADLATPVVARQGARHGDVPAAFAAATGGAVSRFSARDLRNPAYAALVVRDRARRGVVDTVGRALAVDLADLPRVLAEHDAGRAHRVVEWLDRTAHRALGEGDIPLSGHRDVQRVLAARMTTALRTLGVPDIDRI